MSTLGGLLDIRPEERRNTFAAFVTLLALTTGHTLLETARDALFLAKIPATHLPWMYLIIVVIALALSQLRVARADSKGGVAGSLLVAAGITAGFWALLPTRDPSTRALYALYVWTGLFASWAMVQFWTLLGRIHTMTQAKRLYGFIGAGAVIGAVLGAVLARAAMMLSPRSSILVAAVIFAFAAIPCMMVTLPDDGGSSAREDAKRRSREDGSDERPLRASMELLWENAFARRVLGIVLVSTITVTVADYLFKSQLASSYSNPRDLGKYLSNFYAATNALAVVAQLVIAPWLFRRHGVQRALFVFPTLLLGAAGAVLATGGRVPAAVAMKAIDGGLRYSIHKTSSELLLVPVPDGTRERIKPIVDLVGSRGGQALASVAILVLVATGTAQPMTLGAIVLTATVLWLSFVVTIRVLYLDVFRETLRSGGLSGSTDLPELDLGALETLFAGLNSSRDADVIAALELLAEQHRERLIPALILYHPSRDVVLRALEIFTEMGRTDFVSIADRLNDHPDREVAAAALRARTAVSPDRALLERRAADTCTQVAVTGLVALMARGWIEEADAERRIAEVLASKSWLSAAELARAVRSVAPRRGADEAIADRFDELLLQLDDLADSLRDVRCDEMEEPSAARRAEPVSLGITHADVRVRLEVARAMELRKNPRFLPVLVRMLRRHELRAAARAAIVGIPGALEALDEAMTSPKTPREIRLHLPRTICLFEATAAARVLLRHLVTEKGGGVRFKIIRGLVKLRRMHPNITLDEAPVRRAIDDTIAHAEELRAWVRALTGEHEEPPSSLAAADPLRAAHHLLVDLVHDKELHATQRLFLLLELTSDDRFDDIWRGLRSRNAKARASSLELVDNLIPSPLRERILALVGDPDPLAVLPPPMSYEDALRAMIAHDSSTMRTLATYRANEIGLDVTGILPTPAADEERAGSDFEATLGQRLIDKARGLLTPESTLPRGASRAPA